MKGEFKVAVFDLDGTLTNNKKELTPRTQRALMELQAQGVKVVLASGRPTFGIDPIAQALRLKENGGYILSYNGGVILECSTQEVIYSRMLKQSLIEPLMQAAHEEGCAIVSYRGAEILTEDEPNKYIEYEAMLNKMSIRRVDSFIEEFRCDVPKCLAMGDEPRAVALMERLQKMYGDVMSIYRSEPFFVELVPLNVDKGESLSHLAEHLGVASREMIAFGDGLNDLTMIEYVGYGVAMANGHEETRAKANYTTLSNEEDGVAEFIERELL